MKLRLIKNLITLPAITPINEPKAGFNDSLKDLLLVISPSKAPKKGPIMIPIGPSITKAIIRPTVVPICPDLVPPNFFTPNIGIK